MATNALALADVEATNAQYEAQLRALEEQYKDIETVRATLAERQLALPEDGGFSSFVRELSAHAANSGVLVDSFTTGPALPYAPTAADPATDGATADPAAPPAVAVGTTLLAVPVNLAVSSSDFGSLISLIHSLQLGPRLLSISSFTVTVASSDDNGTVVTLTLDGYIYALVSGNGTSTATPTTTPEPTATPSPTPTATLPGETPVPTESATAAP
jgi:hypothetical protein